MTTQTLAMLSLLVAPAQEPHPAIQPRLTEVADHRVTTLAGEDESFGFNEPGLRLTFDLNLRPGYRFAAFKSEDAEVVARDSTGADLSVLEEGAFGPPEHFEAIATWGEEGMLYESFTLRLSQPARSAETFSVDATIPVAVYAGTKTHEMQVGEKRTGLTPAVFGRDATIQLRSTNGATAVTIIPGTLKDAIDKIELILADGEPVDSTSTMWNDASAEYAFPGEVPSSARVRITSRRDFHVVPMRVQIRDMRLP